jgi:hypothetical protein
MLAEELKSLGEFSSGDMKANVLWILLESLYDWICSVVWWNKELAV